MGGGDRRSHGAHRLRVDAGECVLIDLLVVG